MHYNPLAYVHSEKDILKLVNVLITNTKGEGKAGDEFWTKAETLLYTALISYICTRGPENERNFGTLVSMINAMEVHEEDEDYKNKVDEMFDELEQIANTDITNRMDMPDGTIMSDSYFTDYLINLYAKS